LAKELGADIVCAPHELLTRVRSMTQSMVLDDRLTDGLNGVLDCVGSEESLRQALSVVAPRGTVHLVGMPSTVTLDLTPLWHREIALRGSYAYTRDDFDVAIELVRARRLGRLVSAMYPLARYREAIDHAANAGRRGAVKIAFDLRAEKERTR
jgi:threonine dehydrogenase-like Zn-dependent dehydrogenase